MPPERCLGGPPYHAVMHTPADPAVTEAEAEASRQGFPAGAVRLDTSGSERLPILMDMVVGLSRADDPKEVLRVFSEGFARMYGPQGYLSLSTRGLEPGAYKVTRVITDDVPQNIGRADPWNQWSSIPTHRGGFLGSIIENPCPQVIHNLYLRDDPVIGDAMKQYGSMLAIPLFDNGEPLNWSITFGKDPEGFSLRDLEETVLRANLGGATVRNTMITKQLRQTHLEMRNEVEQIASIQRALLPQVIPDIPGLDIDVSYKMFDQAGGDMYALRPLRLGSNGQDFDPSGPWGILVADVSGHGPAAAVVMAIMQSIIETYPGEPAGPAEVLEHANRYLYAKQIESRFVTAFFAIYDPVTRRFTYTRAGHNPPIWMRPDGDGWDMARLDANGTLPLGITGDADFDESTITLEPGQTIVLYTDGITEAMSPDGRMFGVAGIEGSLTECTGYPQCVIGHVTTSLQAHESNRRPKDDQTLVVLRVGE